MKEDEMTVRDLMERVLYENRQLQLQVTSLQEDNTEKLEEIRSLRRTVSDQNVRYEKLARFLGEK